MDYQIQQQCQQTIYIAIQSSINPKTGEESYSTAASYSARVMNRVEKVIGGDGIERVSHNQIILYSSQSIDCLSKIWLPGEDQTVLTEGHFPYAIKNNVDEHGDYDYTKIWLGSGR